MDEDLFNEITRRSRRAHQVRPDVPAEDMLFTIAGDERVETIPEVNASKEPLFFVCMRTATLKAADVFPGSTRVHCNRCQSEVWISPATKMTYDRIPKAEIVCADCLGLMIAAEEDAS